MLVERSFLCVRKVDNEELQGLIAQNGAVYVGIDVWRMLNRSDFCSYPIKKYSSITDAMRDIVNVRKRYKPYYM